MKKFKRRKLWIPLIVFIILAGYVIWDLNRPIPDLKPISQSSTLKLTTTASILDWPNGGQSALGIVGSNILQTDGQQHPLPTASTAKLITALTVLKAKPLSLGQTGPTITLTQNDVDLYDSYVAQDGSVVSVYAGEQISEYQMLEAMLVPSANNIADSLAIWAYGSLTAYRSAASSYIQSLGLNNTTIGSDASGFAPSSTSTASDLVKLGEVAIKNPVIAQIVSQTSVSGIPGNGPLKNINSLLGSDGIVGLKTGNSNQDSGVFISAANSTINNHVVTIVTATMGSASLPDALSSSLTLITSAEANLKPVSVLPVGSIVANYAGPNGQKIGVETSQPLILDTWGGQAVIAKLSLPNIAAKARAGQTVSNLSVADKLTGSQASVPLYIDVSPNKPTTIWRLLHPFS